MGKLLTFAFGLVVAGVLALAIESCSAVDLVFLGENCNTNFNNPANWEDGLPTGTSSPPTTVFFGPQETNDRWEPIYSRAESGTYVFTELIFANNGVLELDVDGTEFELHQEDTTDGIARFTSGQEYTKECDYQCHENFLTTDGEAVLSPPCSRDVVSFPDEYTYKIYLRGFAPVDEIQIGGNSYTHDAQKQSFPTYHTYPAIGLTELFFESDDAEALKDICRANFLYDATSDECLCFSACPSADQERENNERLREAARLLAQERFNEERAPVTKSIDLTFQYRSILPWPLADAAFRDEAFANYLQGNAEENIDAAELAAIAVAEQLENVTLSLEITRFDGYFVVSGTITGPKYTMDTIADNSLLLSVRSIPSIDKLVAHYLWFAISDAAFASLSDTCLAAQNDLWLECLARNGDGCSTLQQLITYSDPSFIQSNVELVLSQLEAYFYETGTGYETTSTTTTTSPEGGLEPTDEPETAPIIEVTSEPTTTDAATTTTVAAFAPNLDGFVFAEETDEAVATSFILGLADPESPLRTQVPIPFANSALAPYLGQYLDCLDISQLRTDAADLNTVVEELFESSFVFGKLLPTSDIIYLLQGWNSDRFRNAVCDFLTGIPPFAGVTCDDVVLEAISYDDYLNRDRRSAGSDAILATIPYTMLYDESLCSAGSESIYCPLVEGSTRHTDISDLLEYLAINFDLSTPSDCVSYADNLDATCLEDNIFTFLFEFLWPNDGARPREAGTTEADWARSASDRFYALIGNCGLDCDYDGVTFRHESYREETLATHDTVVAAVLARIVTYIEASTTTTTTTTTTTSEPNANQSTNNNSALPVPVIGGAAAGLILIILIIIIVLRRRNSDDDNASAKKDTAVSKSFRKSTKKGASFVEREVVAFENPMYDNPGDEEFLGDAIYDSAEIEADNEGLYDEPAFNGTLKDNPVYQSTEHLFDEEEDEDDEDTGYLDVEPEEEDGDDASQENAFSDLDGDDTDDSDE